MQIWLILIWFRLLSAQIVEPVNLGVPLQIRGLPSVQHPMVVPSFVSESASSRRSDEEGLRTQIEQLKREKDDLDDSLYSAQWSQAVSKAAKAHDVLTFEQFVLPILLGVPNQHPDNEAAQPYRDFEENIKAFGLHRPGSPFIERLKTFQWTPRSVDVHHNLTFRHFWENYATKSRPVVIRNYTTSSHEWTLDFIDATCGDQTAFIRRRVRDVQTWGGLSGGERMSVKRFIELVRTGDQRVEGLYLHDWSLPRYCQGLAHDWIVPKYFSQDFVHRYKSLDPNIVDTFNKSEFSHSYHSAWPSLFIGPPRTSSALHIDSFASHFMMKLYSGRD